MNAFAAIIFLMVFSFFFAINAALAAFANRRGARVALIASALFPLAMYVCLLFGSALDIGVIATFSDPKVPHLLIAGVAPLMIIIAIAAGAAQFIAFRWRDRARPGQR